ncbi:unnamed protein product [Ectocarpus sp. 8 AP-2014]
MARQPDVVVRETGKVQGSNLALGEDRFIPDEESGRKSSRHGGHSGQTKACAKAHEVSWLPQEPSEMKCRFCILTGLMTWSYVFLKNSGAQCVR